MIELLKAITGRVEECKHTEKKVCHSCGSSHIIGADEKLDSCPDCGGLSGGLVTVTTETEP